MTDALSPPPSSFAAPDGLELAWLPARLAHVAAVLERVRTASGEVGSTTWRSASATRFRELVGLLADDVAGAAGLLTEAEREAVTFASAVRAAEQVAATTRVVAP